MLARNSGKLFNTGNSKMTKSTDVSMKDPRQSKVSCLLSASIVSVLLATPAFALTDTERINALEKQISDMASGMSRHDTSGESLQIHGFMDVGFTANSMKDPINYPTGFNVGSLSFYLTPHFGDRVKALVEPNFEVTSEGAVSTDLERLQIGYTFSDAATLWGGRFHTPYGYWNTGFHHGMQMQTSVLRPRFLDFEDKGGILPAHMVGLWASGKAKAGNGKFTYDVFAGNGPKIVMGQNPVDPAFPAVIVPQTPGTLDVNLAGDDNHQAMVGLNLGYEFSGRMDGLRVAVHSMRGDVDDDSNSSITLRTLSNKTELNMVGASVVYLGGDWEVMSEYYHFKDRDKSGINGTNKSWADYIQIGRSFNALTPYVRFEKTELNQLDNYFNMQASGQSYSRQALGLRYNLNQNAALKFELLNSSFKPDTAGAVIRYTSSYRSVYAQYAIGF